MPSPPVYLDLNVTEKFVLTVRTSRTISGTVSSGDTTGEESFLSKQERTQIDNLLKLYRSPDNQHRIDAATINALGSLLNKLIGTGQNLEKSSSLILRVKPEQQTLITNIPWELASITPINNGAAPDFSMLLADRSFARTVNGYNSIMPAETNEKLRVHYCISDPVGNLQAPDFKTDLEESIRERSAYIEVTTTASANFQPSFNELLSEIDIYKPDILILACHGRSTQGKPEVQFANRWQPLELVANAVQHSNNNSLVVLIACDLTYGSGTLPSHSGAITFISKGIPAVIAMQSSIMVKCGRILLDSVINYMFALIRTGEGDGTLLRAMAYARRRVFDSFRGSQFSNLDWSFPALFVSAGNEDGMGKIRYWQLGFVSALRNIRAKNFTLPTNYFSRPGIEQQFDALYHSNRLGVCSIGGVPGSGKSALLNYTGDLYYKHLVEGQNGARHLVYIDFDFEASRTLSNPIELFNIINQRIATICPDHIGVRLVSKLKLSSNSLPGLGDRDRILQEMDDKNVIFIFDNLSQQQYENIKDLLITVNHDFRKSLIIVPGYSNDFASVIVTGNLTKAETDAFIKQKGIGVNEDIVFNYTGGNLALLQLIKPDTDPAIINPDLQNETIYQMLDSVGILGDNYAIALGVLAQFDKGLSKGLSAYTSSTWEQMVELKNVGIAATRLNEVNEEVIFVPNITRKFLSAENPEIIELGKNKFLEKFDEFPQADGNVYNKLLSMPGGFDFVLTILRLEKKNFDTTKSQGSLDRIRSLVQLAYGPLYSSSRWSLALELMELHISTTPDNFLRALDWINEGKTAWVLGMTELLEHCILKAEQFNMTISERSRVLELKAGLSKIVGNFDQLPQMLAQYNEAEQLLTSLGHGSDNLTEKEIGELKAILLYNRAIVEYWWAGDEQTAFENLKNAIAYFQSADNLVMKHVGLSEYADMRIRHAGNANELNSIIQDLLVARNFFSGANIGGDLATAYLRLGRAYCKYAKIDQANKSALLQAAAEYFSEASVSSQLSGMEMQELIARGHTIILQGPSFLKKVNTELTLTKLDDVINSLRQFATNSWAARVIRNFGWEKVILTNEVDRLAMLKVVLKDALSERLQIKSNTDAGISAQIIIECIKLIGNNVPGWNEFIVEFKAPTMKWFQIGEFSSSQELKDLLNHIQPIKPYNHG